MEIDDDVVEVPVAEAQQIWNGADAVIRGRGVDIQLMIAMLVLVELAAAKPAIAQLRVVVHPCLQIWGA
jgi:hypothetical protein